MNSSQIVHALFLFVLLLTIVYVCVVLPLRAHGFDFWLSGGGDVL